MRLLTLTDSLLSRRCPLPSPRHPTMIIRVASVCECKGRARAFVRIRDTAWMVENQFRLVSTRKRAPDQWDSQFPTIIGKKRVDFDFVFFSLHLSIFVLKEHLYVIFGDICVWMASACAALCLCRRTVWRCCGGCFVYDVMMAVENMPFDSYQ